MAARWYVVHVYSGSEKKVAESLKEQAEKKGLKDKLLEVLVPTEQLVEIKRGEKVNTEKNFFPGYVLVHMELTDETWHLVRHTEKVSGFLGGRGKPTPISQAEVDRVVGQIADQQTKPRHTLHYDIGENVRVIDGPFSTFTGLVEEVDQDKQRLKVAVTIFGRSTPVDLEYNQVEKA